MCLIAAGCPVKLVMWIRECITNPRFSISLNGSMVGYFKGGKGLRQGDPISPYLFVIAMEAFTRIMQKKVQEPTQFKFHPYCKALKITHLSLADDLLIFTAANLPIINLVKEGLKEFKVASGLDINPSKSEVFFSAMPQDVKWKTLDVLQFKEGTLPVRYLRLPLISCKLRLKDCQPLIDKIQGRIKSWSSRKLSFASRLQLLQSVLYSIQRFWSSNFILPNKVIKTLE